MVFIGLLSFVVRAQNDNVYLVKAFGCTGSQQNRSQTGFRVRGVTGVFTSLHGVVSCKTVKVQSERGVILSEKVNIVKADTKNDVALLSSTEIERLTDDGLSISENAQWAPLQSVQVIGHPFGIKALNTTLTLRNPPVKILKDLLETDALQALGQRKSPSPDIEVLSLQGTILPGHSGSPILDANNKVIGIASGGLRGGTPEINWAIPFKNIVLEVSANNKTLQQIAGLDSGSLFSYDENIPPVFPIKLVRDDSFDKGTMYTEMIISQNGRVDGFTQVRGTAQFDGFCGNVTFWFFDKAGNVLGVYGMGSDHQWCVGSKIETRIRGERAPDKWGEDHPNKLRIPQNVINQTRSVSIVHLQGPGKRTEDLVRDNINKALGVKQQVDQ